MDLQIRKVQSSSSNDIEETGDDDYEKVDATAGKDSRVGEPAPAQRIDVIGDCDDKTYYTVCGFYTMMTILVSIYVDDLSFVFGLIAAFSESILNFVFPGIIFLLAMKKSKGLQKAWYLRFPVAIFASMGMVYFFISNYYNYQKLLRLQN